MFGMMMASAHDLMLNTVFFLMGVIILAGAFTSLISEFGVVSIVNRILSPLMKPLFGLPGAASIGVVATYLSDNPAIMPLRESVSSPGWGQNCLLLSSQCLASPHLRPSLSR